MSKFTLLSEKELNELTKLGFNRTPKFTDYAILTGCQGFKRTVKHQSGYYRQIFKQIMLSLVKMA